MNGSVYILNEIFIKMCIYFPRENIFWYFRKSCDTMYFVGFDNPYKKQSVSQVHTAAEYVLNN